MNIPSLKQKAEAIRHRLEEVENHIAALESDAHAMLGTNPAGPATPGVPALAPALKVVVRGKSKPKRRKPAAKPPVRAGKEAARKSPPKPVQPPVVAAKTPAPKSPKKTSRKNGTKSPSTRKASAAVPASAPVVGSGVGGVDGDFDALG